MNCVFGNGTETLEIYERNRETFVDWTTLKMKIIIIFWKEILLIP